MKLTLDRINKSFSGKHILKDVSFEVESGRAFGFLGRNGAGKTTTIRCLMDVFKQDSGQFLIDGIPFKTKDYKIGYLPEERGLYLKNGLLDQLVYFGQLRGGLRQDCVKSANYWLDRFELGEFKNKPMGILSKGNQQKVQITQAFINEPDILILDEPFSGLDPVNAQIFKDIIREFVDAGSLVIFSSHQMAYVEEMCDDIALIHKGEIILSGNLEQIKQDLGKGKVVLSAFNYSNQELLAKFENAFQHPTEEGIVIELQGLSQQEMLKQLIQQKIEVKSYQSYAPSLNSIFIERAGN